MHEQASQPVPSVADQQLGVVAWLPPGWRDYGLLARIDRPIGTWLLLVPCWWGQALAPAGLDLLTALLFAVGALAMRGAGCTINDLVDRKLDAQVERTRNRPLAAGRLTTFQALAFIAAQMLVGLLVLMALPTTAQLVALASLPLVIAYPFMKRITWWPQAFLGLTFNWGVLVGYAASAGRIDAAALWLYAAGIFWTLGYDTIYAHQDKADDLLVGVRSTALRLGRATHRWMIGFYTAMLACLLVAGMLAQMGPLFYAAAAAAAGHLAWQVKKLDIDDRELCLSLFRANRWTAFLILAALLVGRF